MTLKPTYISTYVTSQQNRMGKKIQHKKVIGRKGNSLRILAHKRFCSQPRNGREVICSSEWGGGALLFQQHFLKGPVLNFQVLFHVMAFKAIFILLIHLQMSIWWQLCDRKQIKKEKPTKIYIYTHLYINLKTLYKWVVIYMMLTLSEKTLYTMFQEKKRKHFKKGQRTGTTSNL